MKNPRRDLIFPINIREFFKERRTIPDFNLSAHEQLHRPRVASFSTEATLASATYPAIAAPRAGMIVNARVNVQGAPASDLSWNVLKNGDPIFLQDQVVSTGDTFSTITEWVDNGPFVADDLFAFQLVDDGGATGPLYLVMEYIPADFV